MSYSNSPIINDPKYRKSGEKTCKDNGQGTKDGQKKKFEKPQAELARSGEVELWAAILSVSLFFLTYTTQLSFLSLSLPLPLSSTSFILFYLLRLLACD
jgi:hypothetical protein